jgi:flagellar biosynthesis/type III secretory pathway ATPase
VFAELPALLNGRRRARAGSITAIYTVLARAAIMTGGRRGPTILDGHIVLAATSRR